MSPRARRSRKASGTEAARRAAEAVDRFLDAVVPPPHRDASDLEGTPERVARAWLDDLLSGYRQEPGEILSETMRSPGGELVAVTGIEFHSMCPHHLMPSRGLAHVAYLPAGRVVGFGQIVRLVDCHAHRLALQEDVARNVAQAISEHLGAHGAACAIDVEQTCLSARGVRRAAARTHVQYFGGLFATNVALQRRFLALAGRGTHGRARDGAPAAPGRRSR